MVVLIDANVVIDFLTTREPFYKASSKVIAKCADRQLEGYIAFHSIPNLWYILRRTPEEKRRRWLSDICEFLRVECVNHEDVVKAIGMTEFKDFEDCLQDRCAEKINAEYVITRNAKDYKGSIIPAITPEEFLETISK